MKKYYQILKKWKNNALKTDDIKLFELCISTVKNHFKYQNLLSSRDYYKSSFYLEDIKHHY